ncbi:hypothetical protein ABZ642_00960 [Streptomyces sp. NPDC007157]|uniref:hypothetical protein n=1 Tax=Streptomyces sp. NPDC007157 TaxID=3154681 RepID=UPI0033ED9B6C
MRTDAEAHGRRAARTAPGLDSAGLVPVPARIIVRESVGMSSRADDRSVGAGVRSRADDPSVGAGMSSRANDPTRAPV